LKALLALSINYIEEGRDRIMPIQEIASTGDMPKKFLEQIFLALIKGGFVVSRRGVNGGFQLARHPRDITVGEVIRFIEGPIEPLPCVAGSYKGCKDLASCIFRGVWKEVKDAISVVIDTLTFEELVLRYKSQKLGSGAACDFVI